MPARPKTVSLAERYDVSELEPDVDREKATAYLLEGSPKQTSEPKRNQRPTAVQPSERPTATAPRAAPAKPDPWTSHTVRLRQSTEAALVKAALAQKTKEVEGKLNPGDPCTVQEIADRGVRLVLEELGYMK